MRGVLLLINDIIKNLQQLKRELDVRPSKQLLLAIDSELLRLKEFLEQYEDSPQNASLCHENMNLTKKIGVNLPANNQ